MEEIVIQLKEKAGLTEEQAIRSLEVIKDFIAGKLPPMFSGFVDNFFTGGGAADHESFLP